jgi:hypothetical protein
MRLTCFANGNKFAFFPVDAFATQAIIMQHEFVPASPEKKLSLLTAVPVDDMTLAWLKDQANNEIAGRGQQAHYFGTLVRCVTPVIAAMKAPADKLAITLMLVRQQVVPRYVQKLLEEHVASLNNHDLRLFVGTNGATQKVRKIFSITNHRFIKSFLSLPSPSLLRVLVSVTVSLYHHPPYYVYSSLSLSLFLVS